MADDIIQFIRQHDYRLIKELGSGACGRTVLLHDDQIDELFVCKKYSPIIEDRREELFENFKREIKLLHRIHHLNVVRVFNYYLYPEHTAGFILMEYVAGQDIDEYIRDAPENANELFLQLIDGFKYLEANKILHRDIRSRNLMVRDDGFLKIIDLGFGKQVKASADFDKSISLNLWCEPPSEFGRKVYDFKTEVYFVGRLFEKLIQENGIDHFAYRGLLARMCEWDPAKRSSSFAEIEREIGSNRFAEIDFSPEELQSYREFADHLLRCIEYVEPGIKYNDDLDRVLAQLEVAYQGFRLEEAVPDPARVINCFLKGEYGYDADRYDEWGNFKGLPVLSVRKFLALLKAASTEKKRIILANLHTRLDTLHRKREEMPTASITDEDVPF